MMERGDVTTEVNLCGPNSAPFAAGSFKQYRSVSGGQKFCKEGTYGSTILISPRNIAEDSESKRSVLRELFLAFSESVLYDEVLAVKARVIYLNKRRKICHMVGNVFCLCLRMLAKRSASQLVVGGKRSALGPVSPIITQL
jgi:hypothetical protein